MARKYSTGYSFRRGSRKKGTRVQVSPDGTTEVLHQSRWFPDIRVELIEDGTKLLVHGLQIPSLVQFSGGDIVWCPLELAGADVDPVFGDKMWEIMDALTLRFPDTWEFETAYARRRRVYEALRVLSKYRHGDYTVNLDDVPGGQSSASCSREEVDCDEDVQNAVVLGDVASENEFATYQIIGRARYDREQVVEWQHDDLSPEGTRFYSAGWIQSYAWWDDEAPESQYRLFANGRPIYSPDGETIRYKDDDTPVELIDGADIDHDIIDEYGDPVTPEPGTKYAVFRHVETRPAVDKDGNYIYRRTGKAYLSYFRVGAKTLTGDYIRDVDPIPEGYTGIGEYWTVELYGHTYVTELYQNDDGTTWWYNPYSEDKFIAAPSPTAVQRYNGRSHDSDTDPAYTAERDPAIHPEILKTAKPVIIDTSDSEEIYLDRFDKFDADIYEWYRPDFMRTFHSLFLFDNRYSDTMVVRKAPNFNEKATNYERIGADIVADSAAKWFGYIDRYELDYTMDTRNALIFDRVISEYELVDPVQALLHFGILRAVPKEEVTYTIPNRLTIEQVKNLLTALNTRKGIFCGRSRLELDIGRLSPMEKLGLYLKNQNLIEIYPSDDPDDKKLLSDGEFWVKDGTIYATGAVRAHCPSPLIDSRFENLYDPLAVELRPDEPMSESDIPGIIAQMRSGEKNKVRTHKVFPEHYDDDGNLVYDKPEDWVVPFLNALAIAFENEELFANIIYPDDKHLAGLKNLYGLEIIRYPLDTQNTGTDDDTYEDDGLPTHDAMSRAKTCLDENAFPYDVLKQQLGGENIARIATIVYFMGKADSDGGSWSRTISGAPYLPEGDELTVEGTETDATATFSGNPDDVGDPFEEYYYVEYRPVLLEDGTIEVAYTAYDMDGNDVTDQVKTASFDRYIAIIEEEEE